VPLHYRTINAGLAPQPRNREACFDQQRVVGSGCRFDEGAEIDLTVIWQG
jgi:hypothetical protein